MGRDLFASFRHQAAFGHWPVWVRFDQFNVCERCLRPPSRPRRWWQPTWAAVRA